MGNIFLESLHIHMFRGHKDIEISFEEITEIYGKNKSGKTTLADAFCFCLTGNNFWGNKFTDLINSGNLAWVEANISDEMSSYKLKRMIEDNHGKMKTTMTEDFEICEKDMFLSLVNPRYFVSLSPSGAKDVLLKASTATSDILDAIFPEQITLISNIDSKVGNAPVSLSEKWEQVEKLKKEYSTKVKALDEKRAQTEGKILAYKQSMEFFESQGVSIPEEMQELFEIMNLSSTQTLVDVENEKDSVEKKIKDIEKYRGLLAKLAVKCLEDNLMDVKIQLEDNGKDVFVITYKDLDYKTLSNSEQLLAGLEIVNALSKVSGINLPCFVDNAEALQNPDVSLYPDIWQLIFMNVSDVDLSIYNNGKIFNPITKQTLVRSKESLLPKVTVIGWEQ